MRLGPRVQTTTAPHRRERIDHIVILDGTMSSLAPGQETNAGMTYRLLREVAGRTHASLRYEEGVQFLRWRDALDVIEGRGIDRQIRRAYGFIASRYRPGDRIFLFGYSRGAYAVRSLAGLIDMIGLVKAQHATVRNIRLAYRHYERDPSSKAAAAFASGFCHEAVHIEMIGVWDTVKALGIRLPILWRYSKVEHAFHNHTLGPSVRHGFHALARDETRMAYEPVLWQSAGAAEGALEQVWFRGTHGDVGGHLGGYEPARKLSNIPLVWMLEKAEGCGIELPAGWRSRFEQDADAPSIGTMRGWGKMFLFRKRRPVGADPSESIHPSAQKPVQRWSLPALPYRT
jgi:uncharacterized protein (DUF2235 family)